MPRRGSLAPPRLALWLLLALLLAAAAEVRARVQLPSQQLASTRAATAAKPVLGDAADAALENAKDDALQDNYNSLTFAEDDEAFAGEEGGDFVPSHVLSFAVQRGRERCFFQDVAAKEFPALPVKLKGAWFISGSSLAMDIVVSKLAEDGASGEPLHANSGQEEGGFTVMAETYGTYSFCFDDARRGGDDKVVTFALHVGKGASKIPATKEHILPLQRTVSELARTLRSLQSQLEIILLRVERHVATQDSIEGRVNIFTLVETVAMVGVAVLQVSYVRRLVNRKQWV